MAVSVIVGSNPTLSARYNTQHIDNK